MALNTDFKVKDSLYVGNSACFVGQTNTPKILSAGEELFNIFVQQNEIPDICSVQQGTAIATFCYDGSADVTVGVNATCNTTWNSAYTTTQANSANWNEAYTWCTTNGDNVIDTVAEGNAQGKVAVTNIANTTTQVDVNGLQTNDSPQFAGACFTGAITTSSSIDGRDVACDGATLDTLRSLSGDNGLTFSSPSQGTLRVTELDGDTTDIDLQVQAGDNVQFANICSTGNLAIDGTVDGRDIAADATRLATIQGLSAANVVSVTCTAQGTLRTQNAAGTCVAIDTGLQTGDSPSFTGLTITSVPTGTSNTVLVSDSGVVTSDEIDSRVWGTSLVDGSGTANQIPLWSDGNTIGNSGITQDANGFQLTGGLSATGTLSGDGSCLTNVVATEVVFPTTSKTDLASSDQFYINDGANKQVTYGCLLSDAAGLGISVDGGDSLCIAGANTLTNCKLPMWNDGNGCFQDTVLTQSSTGNINIAGGLTVMDNLSVMGTFTCLDTSVSTTSALSVINTGTGPALYAEQTGVSQPIAKFVDTEGGQMVIGDTGNVGIGGSVDNPAEKLVVTGNACVTGTLTTNGSTTLGDASGDAVTINGACIAIPNLASGTADSNQILVKDSSNGIVIDTADSKIFGTKLVESSTDSTCTNQIPKFSNSTGTIGNSNIADNGTTVGIDSDTLIGAGHKLTIQSSDSNIYSEDAAFTATVGTSPTTVTTFLKTDLKSVEYQITLVKGVNITTFRVNAVYNGTDQCGTTYAIVDAQAASQLADIEISSGSTTIDLDITAAAAGTTAIIKGTALYN
jgi:hypothetical protein